MALGAFGIAVLVITTGMVRRTRGLTWISICIALPAIALLLCQIILEMAGCRRGRQRLTPCSTSMRPAA